MGEKPSWLRSFKGRTYFSLIVLPFPISHRTDPAQQGREAAEEPVSHFEPWATRTEAELPLGVSLTFLPQPSTGSWMQHHKSLSHFGVRRYPPWSFLILLNQRSKGEISGLTPRFLWGQWPEFDPCLRILTLGSNFMPRWCCGYTANTKDLVLHYNNLKLCQINTMKIRQLSMGTPTAETVFLLTLSFFSPQPSPPTSLSNVGSAHGVW